MYLSCKAVPLLLPCLPEHNASARVPRLPLLSSVWEGGEEPTGLTKLTLVLLQLTHSQAAGPGPPPIINIHVSYKIHSQYHRRRGLSCPGHYAMLLSYFKTFVMKPTKYVLRNIWDDNERIKKIYNHIKEPNN